jgi:signal transduction histidine kinase
MFLKPIHNLTGTLAFRLTAWYAVLFTLCSVLALSIFYYKVSSITLKTIDRELIEEINEFAAMMKEGGIDQIKKYMAVEVESEEGDVFFRLLAPDGRVIAMEGPAFYHRIDPLTGVFDALLEEQDPIVMTLDLPGHEHKLRTVYGLISPEMILQVGISLEESEKYLIIFKRLLLALIFPLFLASAIVGWLLARHALKGVEEVTATAMEISQGAYGKRVQAKQRLSEISRLANTFNAMLDRIQSLLTSMKEITDNVAHDLRGPLTRIRGIAEMTLMGRSTLSDYEKMAASTIEECDTLIDLINTMLDITETEAGISDFKTDIVDLKKLITDACELFQPVADEKHIRLITQLPDDIKIRGDKGKLQRLVTNLLENAVKYTDAGGKVTVSVSKDKKNIHIVFSDTGIGISETDLSKIFDRFYRCDNSRSQPGNGLGLCLAKAIVKAHGGDIRVQSRLTQGSTFTVSLPL